MIVPTPRLPLTGNEPFAGLDGTVRDFWAYALPDLRSNNVRGWLAEYLVARALGVVRPVSRGWDDFDVLADGIRIEVKASAYLQVWPQARLSNLLFTGLKTRSWPADGPGPISEAPTYNADVYVFCVQTATVHDAYDVLDVGQWRFTALPVTVLEQLDVASITWKRVLSIAGDALTFDELGPAIRAVANMSAAKQGVPLETTIDEKDGK